jgi:hypothetical protein
MVLRARPPCHTALASASWSPLGPPLVSEMLSHESHADMESSASAHHDEGGHQGVAGWVHAGCASHQGILPIAREPCLEIGDRGVEE